MKEEDKKDKLTIDKDSVSKDYLLSLRDLDGLIVVLDNEYIQLMLTEDYDVDFQPFFNKVDIDEEKGKRILDFISKTKRK